MAVHYAIRHLTRFRYDDAGQRERHGAAHAAARTTAQQRCLQFEVEVQPRARVFAYRDYLGNWVHHFDIPRRHASARDHRAGAGADRRTAPLPERCRWRRGARSTSGTPRGGLGIPAAEPVCRVVAGAARVRRCAGASRRHERDPLTSARETMAAIHRSFEYAPNTTRVDSPIDETLAARRGVCQDFTHIMLATLRWMGVPCRYVSGYIAPQRR